MFAMKLLGELVKERPIHIEKSISIFSGNIKLLGASAWHVIINVVDHV